jgi:hypothetical protein
MFTCEGLATASLPAQCIYNKSPKLIRFWASYYPEKEPKKKLVDIVH